LRHINRGQAGGTLKETQLKQA